MSDPASRPLVTVVIATRNRPQWLKECVDSVRCQDGVDWELVVVDDCSDEAGAASLQGLEGGPVRVVRQPRPM